MEQGKKVLKLEETRVWRTYTGGASIDQWHGKAEAVVGNFPEDWVASTVSAVNIGREHIPEGNSRVANLDGNPFLKDLLEKDPENYFGTKHLEKFGPNMGVLIKLIDSAERLTIQTHPDKKYAKEVFQSDYGKTESWYILDAKVVNGEEPCVYFGFKPHVTRDKWKEIFEKQDIPAMLDCLHKIPVKAGDSFFIAGGLPHAIGAGCFLAEVQEPTDLTMRTELVTPSGLKIHEKQCHQGVGYEKMLDCFHYEGLSLEETCEKWMANPDLLVNQEGGRVESIIDQRFTPLFQMRKLTVHGEISLQATGQLKIWIILRGTGVLTTECEEISLEQGEFLLIPASLGDVTLSGGDLFLLECLPQKA